MESYSVKDELCGTTEIKNVDTQQEMDFSTPIADVLDTPQQSMMMEAAPAPKQVASTSSKYPLNLKKEQVESIIAGLAGVIGFSDFVQNKLIDNIPQALNEGGKLSPTGMVITLIVIAVLFYFIRKFAMK